MGEDTGCHVVQSAVSVRAGQGRQDPSPPSQVSPSSPRPPRPLTSAAIFVSEVIPTIPGLHSQV